MSAVSCELPTWRSERLTETAGAGVLGAVVAPGGRGAAGLVDDPASDRDDCAGFFCHGDELVGSKQAALGVLPADECLESDDASVCERDDWLVDQPQFVVLDGVP